jgi:hypothetical protein
MIVVPLDGAAMDRDIQAELSTPAAATGSNSSLLPSHWSIF